MTRVAYVDCVSGAAGDMLLGALIDAGAGAERMAEHVRSLGVDGLDLQVGRATRHGIVARRIDVVMPHEEHVHRHLADMRALIDAAGMPERAARRAHRTFQLLAEAEARMHDSEPELVHFHEVGGLDALADVCGVALALEELGDRSRRVLADPLLARLRRRLPRPAAAARAGDARAAARRAARAARDRHGARHADGRRDLRCDRGTLRARCPR